MGVTSPATAPAASVPVAVAGSRLPPLVEQWWRPAVVVAGLLLFLVGVRVGLIDLRLPYQLRWEYVLRKRDLFVDGLVLALQMAAVSLAVGSAIGLVLAFLRASGNRLLAILITAYVELIRNIPLLLIVFIFYYALPQAFPLGSPQHQFVLALLPTPTRTFVIALTIYASAYLTEIFGAGILSVSRRYLDAGRSLGLSRAALARYVTFPIMLRTVLPSLSNTFISLFKDTGIAWYIGVFELGMAANKVNTDFFRPLEGWLAAGILYLLTSLFLAFSLRFAESRIRWTV
jgi:polar amino acid transport system permease protein